MADESSKRPHRALRASTVAHRETNNRDDDPELHYAMVESLRAVTTHTSLSAVKAPKRRGSVAQSPQELTRRGLSISAAAGSTTATPSVGVRTRRVASGSAIKSGDGSSSGKRRRVSFVADATAEAGDDSVRPKGRRGAPTRPQRQSVDTSKSNKRRRVNSKKEQPVGTPADNRSLPSMFAARIRASAAAFGVLSPSLHTDAHRGQSIGGDGATAVAAAAEPSIVSIDDDDDDNLGVYGLHLRTPSSGQRARTSGSVGPTSAARSSTPSAPACVSDAPRCRVMRSGGSTTAKGGGQSASAAVGSSTCNSYLCPSSGDASGQHMTARRLRSLSRRGDADIPQIAAMHEPSSAVVTGSNSNPTLCARAAVSATTTDVTSSIGVNESAPSRSRTSSNIGRQQRRLRGASANPSYDDKDVTKIDFSVSAIVTATGDLHACSASNIVVPASRNRS